MLPHPIVCKSRLTKCSLIDFCTVLPSPLVTDPGDGEVLDGHVGLVQEHEVHEDGEHGEREIVERRKSTKDIESFVCGIQVEDALKAVMENAHRNEDTGSESNDLHKVCSEDEDPCEEGVNGIYESEQRGEISPSQEEDFVFSEVNEDVQDITQDQGLHANEEMLEESLTGKIESMEPSMEAEINDSRRFDGKLSRQQELRQSENEVG